MHDETAVEYGEVDFRRTDFIIQIISTFSYNRFNMQ